MAKRISTLPKVLSAKRFHELLRTLGGRQGSRGGRHQVMWAFEKPDGKLQVPISDYDDFDISYLKKILFQELRNGKGAATRSFAFRSSGA